MSEDRVRSETERDEKSRATDEEGARVTNERERRAADESPPFGRSWAVLYAAVLLNLALMVVLFYLFTRAFR